MRTAILNSTHHCHLASIDRSNNSGGERSAHILNSTHHCHLASIDRSNNPGGERPAHILNSTHHCHLASIDRSNNPGGERSAHILHQCVSFHVEHRLDKEHTQLYLYVLFSKQGSVIMMDHQQHVFTSVCKHCSKEITHFTLNTSRIQTSPEQTSHIHMTCMFCIVHKVWWSQS